MIPGLLCLALTVGIYYAVKWFHGRTNKGLLSPLLVTPIVLIILLCCTDIPVTTYNSGTKWLTALLQPATVAFAIPLYKYWPILKKHLAEIAVSVLCGSLISIVSSALIAGWMHLSTLMIDSLIPRSVTTPIAMGLSEAIGGNPTITAIIVIITGLLGTVIGPLLIRMLRIHNDISRGVLLGMGAHGAGTAKAFELGSFTGVISSVSMILAAMITLCITPWIVPYL